MIHILRIVIPAVVCVMCSSALAEPPMADAHTVLSKVESLFIREHEGLFIETRLVSRARRDKDVWALVRFEGAGHGRSASELTKVPPGIELHAGDIVEISLAETKSISSVGPIRLVGRVIKRMSGDTQLAGQPLLPRPGD